ncbi:MAG: hypothetical protein ACRC1H_20720 [Caldilineaceae bacterium]
MAERQPMWANQPPLPPQPQPKPSTHRRSGLELLFLVGFIVSLLVGAAALALLWNLTRPAPLTSSSDLAVLFDPQDVVVGLATRNLAGDDSTALISQALRAGELDTAAALLLFDTTSTPAARVALWQQLARHWLESGDTARAAVAFDRAQQLAVLEPALHSLGRSQTLIQAASGLAAAGQPEAATDAAWQALRSIAQSPNLLPAQRSELLQNLRPIVSGPESVVDDPLLAAQVEELLLNPFGTPAGLLVPSTWALLQAPVAPDATTAAALAAAAENRRLLARNLADRDVLTGGLDVEPERIALAQALVAEDSFRAQTAQTLLGGATTLQEQIAILLQEQQRLVAKLQVARRAFGMSIVPEWEAARGPIEADLAAVTTNIDRLVGALADAQATPLEQNLLRAEAAHWLAVQSVLGYWPGGSPEQLSERLRFAQDELERLGSALALPIAYDAAAPIPGFRILARE